VGRNGSESEEGVWGWAGGVGVARGGVERRKNSPAINAASSRCPSFYTLFRQEHGLMAASKVATILKCSKHKTLA
jgi:hypothetical protein